MFKSKPKSKLKINYEYFKSIPIYYKVLGLVCCVAVSFSAVYLFVQAGTINSPGDPSSTGRMYTLEQIYQRIYTGTDSAKNDSFNSPSTGPASTMHTLDDIYGAFSADVTATSGTLAANVASGSTFFATSGTTRGTNWGPVAGTYEPAGGGGLPKTGQTTSYADYDDGWYETGTAKSYTDNEDGTVTDNVTGLMWVQSGYANTDTDPATTYTTDGSWRKYTWANAILYCERLNFAGKTDWRLPNIYELFSIALLEPTHGAPFIDTTNFTNTKSSTYWSSTTSPSTTTNALNVGFSTGRASYGLKTTAYYVRCVRGQ